LAYTSFFRDAEILDAIGAIVVPWASAQQEIKLWDAGCATGEEAYSLAMIFAERLDPFTIRNLRIVATDREESSFPQFEAKITQGLYHRQELMWVPEPLRSTYFSPTPVPDQFTASAVIRDCIKYIRHDLLTLEPIDTGFALVVCKNVLMHCPEAMQPRVVDMFWQALRPGGYLAFDCFQALPVENQYQFEQVESGLQLFRKRTGAACAS
jgi:chemotaxis protein methyltransferase CheR